jgi:hypothetical protein
LAFHSHFSFPFKQIALVFDPGFFLSRFGLDFIPKEDFCEALKQPFSYLFWATVNVSPQNRWLFSILKRNSSL